MITFLAELVGMLLGHPPADAVTFDYDESVYDRSGLPPD